MTLSELNIGDKARICGYLPGSFAYRQQLLAMGLTPDAEFVLQRRAPFGGPIQIMLHNASVGVRAAEAAMLVVERMPA